MRKDILVGCLLGLSVTLAAVAAETIETELVGAVQVTKNDAGDVTAVIINSEAGEALEVVLNEEGKKMAQHEGKKVKVTGTVTEKEEKKVLTVKKAVPVEQKR